LDFYLLDAPPASTLEAIIIGSIGKRAFGFIFAAIE
jgi:hypothetical protein